jgi:cytochrome P450
VAVVALGAVRNVEWLRGSGLAADERGVVCDGACRAFDADGIVTDDVFVAGDVARWPHPLYDGQLLPNIPSFIFLDPPDHDRLRRLVVQQFTPDRVLAMHDRVEQLVGGLLDAQRGRAQIDIVDDLAYPLPVTVICDLLGVPREDEPRFHGWATALARSLDPAEGMPEEQIWQAAEAFVQLQEYLAGLIAARRARPADDMLSRLVVGGAERMNELELVLTASLLLVAGHETTVNLTANGMLTLLRHRDALERLRLDPGLVTSLVEEVLRYDPPVQFRTRTTLADVDIAGVTIRRGETVVLLLAAGNRDPRCFPDPDRFMPDRPDNAHLGFGGGIHYCMGAPLARLEAHVALGGLARRLVGARLVTDPPPYRANASLRGPRHLVVASDPLAD